MDARQRAILAQTNGDGEDDFDRECEDDFDHECEDDGDCEGDRETARAQLSCANCSGGMRNQR